MLTTLTKVSQEKALANHDCIALFISANGQKGKIRVNHNRFIFMYIAYMYGVRVIAQKNCTPNARACSSN